MRIQIFKNLGRAARPKFYKRFRVAESRENPETPQVSRFSRKSCNANRFARDARKIFAFREKALTLFRHFSAKSTRGGACAEKFLKNFYKIF